MLRFVYIKESGLIMKIKTSELTDVALDRAVAECNYVTCYFDHKGRLMEERGDLSWVYAPSTDWSQGGPIIEREMIQLTPKCMVNPLHGWVAAYRSFDEDDDVYALHRMRGKTALIAAMRCYVASKLGDTVEIPEELL